MRGKVVSPSTATQTDGTYWGYTVRMANSIKAVFDECPYGTYDLTIGTSERGSESVDEPGFSLLSSSKRTSRDYRHALIVFGGVAGIEECVDADESLKISGSTSYTMFDKWINVCPYQGSRTIRSEEAILVTLAKLSPLLVRAACTSKEGNTERLDSVDDLSPLHQNKKSQVEKSAGQALTIKFDDNDVSEESSESEMDDE
jgi:predicted SPOUT superfamily RNA methylase MTH1